MKEPTDNLAYRFPVSIKGVVLVNDQIPLLLNERNEYELPGGKLEYNETPTHCVEREIFEELNIKVVAKTLIDTWIYTITPNTHVLIITYFCKTKAHKDNLCFSNEHKALKLFSPAEIESVYMPNGYKNSIKTIIKKGSNK